MTLRCQLSLAMRMAVNWDVWIGIVDANKYQALRTMKGHDKPTQILRRFHQPSILLSAVHEIGQLKCLGSGYWCSQCHAAE